MIGDWKQRFDCTSLLNQNLNYKKDGVHLLLTLDSFYAFICVMVTRSTSVVVIALFITSTCGDNNHNITYTPLSSGKNWQDAKADCVSKGSNLVTATTVNQIYIDACDAASIAIEGGKSYWSGLNRMDDPSGTDWKWASGDVYNEADTQWAPNYPQTGADTSDCVVIASSADVNAWRRKLLFLGELEWTCCDCIRPYCCEPPKCQSWCENHNFGQTSWQTKCSWASCELCDACNDITPYPTTDSPSEQPSIAPSYNPITTAPTTINPTKRPTSSPNMYPLHIPSHAPSNRPTLGMTLLCVVYIVVLTDCVQK